MRIGLSMYGTVFSMGLHSASGRPAITPEQLLDQAQAANLEGIELPVSLLKNADVDAVARYARERNLFISLATGGYNVAHLQEVLELAPRLGAHTVRTVAGGAKFGGDRRELAARWPEFMQEVFAALREASKTAERLQVNLALENHQDLASEELLWLCEKIGSPYFGIILDTGNPLATAEEPLDFAQRMLPYLKHVHLKDYWIYLTEEGYRLVRSPLGQGVIDFAALFTLFAKSCPDITMAIELGALEARHTRVLADDYWPAYPPRSGAQLASVLRFVYANARPASDWRTPFERQEPVENIIAYEQRQLDASLAYMHILRKEFDVR